MTRGFSRFVIVHGWPSRSGRVSRSRARPGQHCICLSQHPLRCFLGSLLLSVICRKFVKKRRSLRPDSRCRGTRTGRSLERRFRGTWCTFRCHSCTRKDGRILRRARNPAPGLSPYSGCPRAVGLVPRKRLHRRLDLRFIFRATTVRRGG